jgi:hypothetical protein
MAKRLFVFALQVAIVVWALAGGALAQTTSGLITGTVTDSSGGTGESSHRGAATSDNRR